MAGTGAGLFGRGAGCVVGGARWWRWGRRGRRRGRCLGLGRGLLLRLDLLVEGDLALRLGGDELCVDFPVLVLEASQRARLFHPRRLEVLMLTGQIILRTAQHPDGVVIVRVHEVEQLDALRRVRGARAVEEHGPERVPAALVRRDRPIVRDSLELGHPLPRFVDAGLQVGDLRVELLGALERIEIRPGHGINFRLGLGDGVVRLGDRVSFLRGRRRRGRGERRDQKPTGDHERDHQAVALQGVCDAKRYRPDGRTSRISPGAADSGFGGVTLRGW